MRRKVLYFVPVMVVLLVNSCGIHGDPGHCFFSLNWEYYNDEYGVYYYEDDNPGVPDFDNIIADLYYDCYPGLYEYYYESEDLEYLYTYTGEYELIQNPGSSGGLFHDGADGVDTYFDLYLYVDSDLRKDVEAGVERKEGSAFLRTPRFKDGENVQEEPMDSYTRSWSETKGLWTLNFTETVNRYKK